MAAIYCMGTTLQQKVVVTHKSKMAETNKSPFLRNLQDIVIARRRSCSFTEYWKHFMAHLKVNGVHAFGYDLDEIWGTLSTLFAAGPGRFWARLAQKREWEGEPKFCFFCQVSNARFHQLPVSQISRNLHTTCGRWILLEQNFENFPIRGRFFPKRQLFGKTFNDFWLQAP